MNTCTVNSAGTACIDAKNTCGLYDTSEKCGYATTDGPCVWDVTCKPRNCESVTLANDVTPGIDTCSAK